MKSKSFFLFLSFIIAALLFFTANARPPLPRMIQRGPQNELRPKRQQNAIIKVSQTTRLQSTEINTQIDVSLVVPQRPRFADGAPVVVIVHPAQQPSQPGQIDQYQLSAQGFVVVQFGYPNRPVFDQGGPNSKQVVKDVLLFAMGQKTDVNGKTLKDLVSVPVSKIVGAVGISHGGNAIITTLESHAAELKDLSFYVSYESPCATSLDRLGDTVLGDNGAVRYDPNEAVDASGDGIAWNDGTNPFYAPETGIDFSKIKWDPNATFKSREQQSENPQEQKGLKDKQPLAVKQASGVPPQENQAPKGVLFLDANGNGVFDGSLSLDTNNNGQIDKTEDYAFGFHVFARKRAYSLSVIRAAQAAQTFGSAWPANISTTEETQAYWQERDMEFFFEKMAPTFSNLKVIIVSYQQDHVQSAKDAPHIRAQYEGLRKRAGVSWVKINPSFAYMNTMLLEIKASSYTDALVNQEIAVADIGKYQFSIRQKGALKPLAVAATELADRVKTGTNGTVTKVLVSP